MTRNQGLLNSVFVRYEGNVTFKFMEGEDFFDDDIKSVDGRSESEDLIESACPEIDNFTITESEYNGKTLCVSARISGSVLMSVPWHRSDMLRPDQNKFIEAKAVSYLSAGIDCVQSMNVTVSTQDPKVMDVT